MFLVASIIFSALLTNSAAIPIDSLMTNPSSVIHASKEVDRIVNEVKEMHGANVKYIGNIYKQQDIWVKFDFGILFPTGESTLNDASKDILTKLSEILIKNPSTKMVILGYTDNISSLELNQRLSENRARAVADFLISKKVTTAQLKEIAGKNYSDPVADNSTETGRAANRRVEMFLVFSPGGLNRSDSVTMRKEVTKTKELPSDLKLVLQKVIQPPGKTTDVEIEIDGLLVNETKTKAGNDFYGMFYDGWEAPATAKNYSITVSEKPYQLTSSLITISINEEIVYQSILQPRQDLIESQTQEAIGVVQNYLTNYEEIMKQMNGEDLGGSGIF